MAGHSDYTRGEMEISSQEGTFDGFMVGTTYGGALIAVMLLFPILVFGVNLGWFPALAISWVVAILAGIALKLSPTWYGAITALTVVTGLICAIFSALI